MKTNEQIKLAQETIESLQDYVELSKVIKKLKKSESKESIEEQLDAITNTVQVQVERL